MIDVLLLRAFPTVTFFLTTVVGSWSLAVWQVDDKRIERVPW